MGLTASGCRMTSSTVLSPVVEVGLPWTTPNWHLFSVALVPWRLARPRAPSCVPSPSSSGSSESSPFSSASPAAAFAGLSVSSFGLPTSPCKSAVCLDASVVSSKNQTRDYTIYNSDFPTPSSSHFPTVFRSSSPSSSSRSQKDLAPPHAQVTISSFPVSSFSLPDSLQPTTHHSSYCNEPTPSPTESILSPNAPRRGPDEPPPVSCSVSSAFSAPAAGECLRSPGIVSSSNPVCGSVSPSCVPISSPVPRAFSFLTFNTRALLSSNPVLSAAKARYFERTIRSLEVGFFSGSAQIAGRLQCSIFEIIKEISRLRKFSR